MGFSSLLFTKKTHLLLFLFLCFSLHLCSGSSRKLASLVKESPLVLSYHNGPLLTGNLSFSILFYGRFTTSQRAILLDFFRSLNFSPPKKPSVSSWWRTLESYQTLLTSKTALQNPKIYSTAPLLVMIRRQTFDESYSLGKLLTRVQISQLASSISSKDNVAVVFTSDDVAVDGFCTSGCSRHGSVDRDSVYVWVGNSVSQCPGQCAWPFHQPIYGPQGPPLMAPNGDVGADGMVIGLAAALSAAVTNPFRTGFFQGPASAPLEASSACTGAFGSGAYPGYPGQLSVDPTTGGSYNANGVHGRKYLLPALWDPLTSKCSTLV